LKLADFGFTEGINEVIAITFSKDGKINTAPIGITVENANSQHAKIKLYPSHTRRNVEAGSKLWANIIYDPIVWVISAFEDLDEGWFESLNPPIIRDSLAWCEFKCQKVRDNNPAEFKLTLTDGAILRKDLRAVNRGFNALIEALVHATRYRVNRDQSLFQKIKECGVIVDKCGSRREKEAFEILLNYIR